MLARAAVYAARAGDGAMRVPLVDHGLRDTIYGETRLATLTSPAGLRIDLVQR